MGVLANGPYEIVARRHALAASYADPLDGEAIGIVSSIWMAKQICSFLNTWLGPMTHYVYRVPRRARIRAEMCEYFESEAHHYGHSA